MRKGLPVFFHQEEAAERKKKEGGQASPGKGKKKEGEASRKKRKNAVPRPFQNRENLERKEASSQSKLQKGGESYTKKGTYLEKRSPSTKIQKTNRKISLKRAIGEKHAKKDSI